MEPIPSQNAGWCQHAPSTEKGLQSCRCRNSFIFICIINSYSLLLEMVVVVRDLSYPYPAIPPNRLYHQHWWCREFGSITGYYCMCQKQTKLKDKKFGFSQMHTWVSNFGFHVSCYLCNKSFIDQFSVYFVSLSF